MQKYTDYPLGKTSIAGDGDPEVPGQRWQRSLQKVLTRDAHAEADAQRAGVAYVTKLGSPKNRPMEEENGGLLLQSVEISY